LGIAEGYPIYITEIDIKHNRIVVGKKEDVFKREFLIKEPHFIAGIPVAWAMALAKRKPGHGLVAKKKIAARVKIRYNHKEALAWLWPYEDKIKVRFKTPQFAITPGQSAVFYDKDTVLGGGIIERCY
jgi:tRNA-specific 2-thiouridylase